MGRASAPLLVVLVAAAMAYGAVARPDPATLDAGISHRRQLQAGFANVMSLIRSRPDLTVAEALIQQFPHVALSLMDPAFVGTLFLPSDAAWLKYRNSNSTRDIIRGFYNDFEPFLSTSPGIRESGLIRFWWGVASHQIVPGKAYTAADLKNPKNMESALQYSPLASKVVKGQVVIVGDQGEAEVQIADLKAGKAILHIIGSVLVPGLAPPDDFPFFNTTSELNFTSIMQKSTLWTALNAVPPTNGPYTVFSPSDAAVTKYLAAKKTTLAKLLANHKACDAIAKAHVIQGTALWLWDLMAVGVAAPTAQRPTFLNGSPLVVSPSTLSQKAFIKSGSVLTEVTTSVDLGGNDFGCNLFVDGDCMGDYTSVFHGIDAILLP